MVIRLLLTETGYWFVLDTAGDVVTLPAGGPAMAANLARVWELFPGARLAKSPWAVLVYCPCGGRSALSQVKAGDRLKCPACGLEIEAK